MHSLATCAGGAQKSCAFVCGVLLLFRPLFLLLLDRVCPDCCVVVSATAGLCCPAGVCLVLVFAFGTKPWCFCLRCQHYVCFCVRFATYYLSSLPHEMFPVRLSATQEFVDETLGLYV